MKERYKKTVEKSGREERNIEITQKLLSMGLSIDDISEATGLSIEEIHKLIDDDTMGSV